MESGTRIGRFVVVRDVDGRLHAIALGAISAVSDDGEGGAMLMVHGMRLHVEQSVEAIMVWIAGPSGACGQAVTG